MADSRRRVLAGRYEIESVVGEGGMAKVFRGTDTVLGRTVAVKVLAPHFSRDGQFVERFRREAQAAAALSHPNVVSVFDTGSDNGVHFIVMEYVDGRTLRDVLRDGRLHPDRAAEVAEAVCRALASAHERGLVHRDVKPGNIMLTPSGEVKVMDFGIARATTGEALTQTATVLGTASYFSPEQAKGEGVDARSDIYSMGCVLYEMLTGAPPFTGDSPVSIAYKHVREDPDLPSRRNPDVSSTLEAVVMKAMAKNQANRYQSAVEMADDLARMQQGLPVIATPVLPGEPTQVVARAAHDTSVMRPVVEEEERRSRALPIALVSILLAALVGGAGWLLIRELTAAPPQVTVPDVVGFSEESARQRIERAGLDVRVEQEANEAAPGTVLRQDPAAGEDVEEGSLVTIVVSTGPEQIEVPDLIGKTVEDARAELQELDLRLATEARPNEDVDAGLIFDQAPAANTPVRPGTTVRVTVSRGRETVVVLNVQCDPFDEAKERIEGEGLVFEESGPEFSEECPSGTVARTDPEAGEEVEVGSTVQAFESLGPSPTPPPILPTPPSPSPT